MRMFQRSTEVTERYEDFHTEELPSWQTLRLGCEIWRTGVQKGRCERQKICQNILKEETTCRDVSIDGNKTDLREMRGYELDLLLPE